VTHAQYAATLTAVMIHYEAGIHYESLPTQTQTYEQTVPAHSLRRQKPKLYQYITPHSGTGQSALGLRSGQGPQSHDFGKPQVCILRLFSTRRARRAGQGSGGSSCRTRTPALDRRQENTVILSADAQYLSPSTETTLSI
jgi:hypothetical protein